MQTRGPPPSGRHGRLAALLLCHLPTARLLCPRSDDTIEHGDEERAAEAAQRRAARDTSTTANASTSADAPAPAPAPASGAHPKKTDAEGIPDDLTTDDVMGSEGTDSAAARRVAAQFVQLACTSPEGQVLAVRAGAVAALAWNLRNKDFVIAEMCAKALQARRVGGMGSMLSWGVVVGVATTGFVCLHVRRDNHYHDGGVFGVPWMCQETRLRTHPDIADPLACCVASLLPRVAPSIPPADDPSGIPGPPRPPGHAGKDAGLGRGHARPRRPRQRQPVHPGHHHPPPPLPGEQASHCYSHQHPHCHPDCHPHSHPHCHPHPR